MKASLLAAALIALPFAVPAETIGTITALMDGAEERTYYANILEGESQSFWLEVMPGSLTGTSFSIWANPSEDANATSDVLILSATLARGPSGYLAAGDAQYLENGFSQLWVADADGGVDIQVTRAEVDGETLVIEGTFTAPLTFAEGGGQPVLDPSRQMVVTGSFAATLPKE